MMAVCVWIAKWDGIRDGKNYDNQSEKNDEREKKSIEDPSNLLFKKRLAVLAPQIFQHTWDFVWIAAASATLLLLFRIVTHLVDLLLLFDVNGMHIENLCCFIFGLFG